ncbi:MAG TPA: hypothetical protein VKN73_02330, partial [Desulfosalsimonadaceae bacterium]|nr:hypothetical protein [Desulfosalsimonadaceae bacterium]
MKSFVTPKMALCMIFFFVLNIIGCSSGGSSGGSDDNLSAKASLEENLTTFNTAATWVTEDMAALYKTIGELNTAIETDDASPEKTEEVGGLVDQFGYDADALMASIETMDQAEAEIQEAIGTETGVTSIAVSTAIGVGLTIYGLYSFGSKMKEYSDDMTEHRKERDEAADGVMNNEDGALEKFEQKNKDMGDTGRKAAEEVTTKIASDIMLTPVNPSSTTGVIIKHIAGNKLQDGLKVISTTEECKDGYDSPGCKIGVDVTDDEDSAAAPAGNTTVVITGDGLTRTVDEKNITEDTYEEITFDPLPIADAADEMLPSDDDEPGDKDDPKDEPGDDEEPGDEPGDDDDIPAPAMDLSFAKASEDTDSITYNVAAAVSGVTERTSVTISFQNAATSGSTKTISEDSTVIWSVTVLDKDAVVTVSRSDTGESEPITLPGKTINYDGTYKGTATTTFEGKDCFCVDSATLTVFVSGSTLSGSVTGTLSG